jgi:hypothetical protein
VVDLVGADDRAVPKETVEDFAQKLSLEGLLLLAQERATSSAGRLGRHDPVLLVIQNPGTLAARFSQQAGIEQGLDHGRFLQVRGRVKRGDRGFSLAGIIRSL